MTAARFAGAIARVGERLELVKESGITCFTGCIQARRTYQRDVSGPAGHGIDRRPVLYAVADDVSAVLVPGDEIRAKSGCYQIISVDDYTLLGETVYRIATLSVIQVKGNLTERNRTYGTDIRY